jgi:hypothetical protein
MKEHRKPGVVVAIAPRPRANIGNPFRIKIQRVIIRESPKALVLSVENSGNFTPVVSPAFPGLATADFVRKSPKGTYWTVVSSLQSCGQLVK